MAKSMWLQPGNRFNSNSKAPRLDALLPIKKLKSGVFYKFRFVGPYYSFAEHWIPIRTKEGRIVKIRKLCLAYDHKTGEFTRKCPYCDLAADTPRVHILQNAIDRKAQRNEPKNKPKPLKSESKLQTLSWDDSKIEYYIKDKDSETWTPVEPIKLSSNPSKSIANYASLNRKTMKNGMEKVFPPEHDRYGFDIQIKYDENQNPSDQYFVAKEKRNSLSDEEMDYPVYNLHVEDPEPYKEAKKNADSLAERIVEDDKDKKDGKDKKRSARDYINDNNDNNNNEDDEDDRNESKRKGKGRPSMNDNNNNEDDEPRSKKASKRSRKNNNDNEDFTPRSRKKNSRNSRLLDDPF